MTIQDYRNMKIEITRLWVARDALIDARAECKDVELKAFYQELIDQMAKMAERQEALAHGVYQEIQYNDLKNTQEAARV